MEGAPRAWSTASCQLCAHAEAMGIIAPSIPQRTAGAVLQLLRMWEKKAAPLATSLGSAGPTRCSPRALFVVDRSG